jgi:hypothetical protein
VATDFHTKSMTRSIMKKTIIALSVIVFLLAVVGLLRWWAGAPSEADKAAVILPAASGPAVPSATALPAPVIQAERPTVPAAATIDQSAPAEISMAAAREHGDLRAPPLTRVKESDEPPTAAELADPKLYQAYEQRQASRGYASYVKAVNDAIPAQQAALAEAKAKGMPADMVAVGEEKIRRMQEMRDQLLATHPEINH